MIRKSVFSFIFFVLCQGVNAAGKPELKQAVLEVIQYYENAWVVSTFCANRFLDMQPDLIETRNTWMGRNRQIRNTAVRIAKVKNFPIDDHRIRRNNLRAHPVIKPLLLKSDSQLKSHCFDAMVVLDENNADIKSRYPSAVQVIELFNQTGL